MLKEASEDQLRLGMITQAEHDAITLRHLESPKPVPKKAPTKKVPNRAVEAILEMADDQLSSGLITQAEHDILTLRHSLPPAPYAANPGSGGVKGAPIKKKL